MPSIAGRRSPVPGNALGNFQPLQRKENPTTRNMPTNPEFPDAIADLASVIGNVDSLARTKTNTRT
jgi:hypothetical protein